MTPEEYTQHDATALAELVRRGEVSPAELVECAIAQIEALNPGLNAVITPMFDQARAEASRGKSTGSMHGVPFVLKDLLADCAGVPTSAGSRLFSRHVPTQDSEIVRRYRAAGLLIVGKTNTPELGLMGVTEPELYGPTRNPYDRERTPGGSSGGSAAAVAARMVPAAHGGDGGGSIRLPASACGLVGLKPTRGRTPVGPDQEEKWSGYVCQHALTRTVRDSAALLDIVAGPEAGAPYHAPVPERPFAQEVGRDPGRLRIAFTTDALFDGHIGDECRAAVEATAKHLADLGHDVTEDKPEFDRAAMTDAYLSTVAASVYGDLAHAERVLGLRVTPGALELPTWILREIGRTLSAGHLMQLHNIQGETRWIMSRFHDNYDVFVTATMAQPPAPIGALLPTLGERFGLQVLRRLPLRPLLRQALAAARKQLAAYPNTQIFNITGQPAISLPVHRTSQGLPVGVQLAARFGDEGTLLRVASQLETKLRWDEQRPQLGG